MGRSNQSRHERKDVHNLAESVQTLYGKIHAAECQKLPKISLLSYFHGKKTIRTKKLF